MPLTTGTHTYTITSTDAAGNESAGAPYVLTYTRPSTGGGGNPDVCANIPGYQSMTPTGYTRVDKTCTLTNPSPVVCAVGEKFNRDTGLLCTTNTPTTPNTTNPVPANDDVNQCKPVVVGNVIFGRANNPVDVNAVLDYLNKNEGENLPLDGVYDATDVLAVKRFQNKYFNEIIAPWGGRVATGNVAGYTRGKMNVTSCGKTLGCPYFTSYAKLGTTGGDVSRIQNFLNLLLGTKLNEKTYNQTVINAVKQYQSLYRATVLAPIGLRYPTGIWAVNSTKTANQIVGCAVPKI
jgi:hypothetical protein